MFPTPIPEDARSRRALYMGAVVVMLMLWLLPLGAIMMTSLRSTQDIMSGNYWGWPTHIAWTENYRQVFEQTAMLRYFGNSLVITLPAVAAA